MKLLRILVIDDHRIVRDGLTLLLNSQPDMEVVGEAENGKEVLEAISRLTPDVVVMDISTPEMDELEAMEAVRALHPEVKVLILTTHEDLGIFARICQAGSAGYVLKRVVGAELVSTIRKVAAGQLHFDGVLAGRTLAKLSRATRPSPDIGNRLSGGISSCEEEAVPDVVSGQ